MLTLITFLEIATSRAGAAVCGVCAVVIAILVLLAMVLRRRTLIRVDAFTADEFRVVVHEGLLRAGYFVWGDKVSSGGPPMQLVTLFRRVPLGPLALEETLRQGPSFIVTNQRVTRDARRAARAAGAQVIDRPSLARLVEGLKAPCIVYEANFSSEEERRAA